MSSLELVIRRIYGDVIVSGNNCYLGEIGLCCYYNNLWESRFVIGNYYRGRIYAGSDKVYISVKGVNFRIEMINKLFTTDIVNRYRDNQIDKLI